ncbi:MAG: methylated-DNA--[protein]-cysteine S-methyltransferase [Propionibacteriaceae bacterium]|nr:methylated-DNA--[protein]-cysteine S-methyltransferase [Propionibacteriaceae bacterium]
MAILKARFESPMGPIVAAAVGDAVTGLWFDGQRGFPAAASEWSTARSSVLGRLGNWLEAYFAGDNPPVDFELAADGTAFQRRVWAQLRQIGYGQTDTYGAIAKRLAAPGQAMAAQAVGQAVGRNPISIVIPCHRVVGANAKLTGYGGGLDRKEALLRLEGALSA